MKDKDQMFIWSNWWWFEGDKAWFVDGRTNTLFCVDLNTGECEKVDCVPTSGEDIYCQNPYCVKCGRDIYCIPGYGGSIWIYNLDDNTFTEVDIDIPKQHLPGSQFWIWGDILFIVMANWNKVIEVSISQRRITNYYIICENDSVRRSVLVGDQIYAVSSETGRIYQFDILTKDVRVYIHSEITKKLFTICFDGEKFWLGGYQKDIYIWDKEKDNLAAISFPDDIQIGRIDNDPFPMFGRAVAVGEYIWFIPGKAESIIYANKKTTVLSVFEICEEDKICIPLQNSQGVNNYVFQYVRDDRYIGFFSPRSSRIFEIDAKQLTYQWKEYYLSEQYLQQYCDTCKGIYYEGRDPLCIPDYHMRSLTAGRKSKNIDTDSIGKEIYTRLKGDVQ
ncbi:MAG: hypothetical protein K2N34_04735 [Lachnospiraceae bacterium]|nr:hypothetical protein [Lachnospiraceae bacterium]